MSEIMTVEQHHEVEYPESDGEPMAETDLHRDEMLALIDALKWHFRDRGDVYVSGNNFVYYQQGDPKAVFSPDVYVVKGVAKHPRRTYKLWEDKEVPCFVLELSSRKTWLEDIGNKKALGLHLGIREYFLYDPEGDVVKPPLQGYRLDEGTYRRIAPRSDGSIASEALGVELWLDEALRLHARDATSGEPLLRPEEVRERAQSEAEARRRAEEGRTREAEARRRAEEGRTREAEARRRAEEALRRAEADRDALATRLREIELDSKR